MDAVLRQRLANQIASGSIILFTGAGFSLSAYNLSGTHLPTVRQLREKLWQIVFPNAPFDEYSQLGDLYEVATSRAGSRVGELLRNLLQVDGRNLPECYRKWFSFPWYRIYTLNMDDMDEVVQGAYNISRRIQSISAFSESIPEPSSDLLSIHLNGKVSEYPNVTFSPRQYGERTARQEPWYSHVVADILSHPVLFVGTVLDEPLLWQHIELRRSRIPQQRELRPGSYLVTPEIPAARRMMLDDFNIKLIEMTQEEFVEQILDTMEAEKQQGFMSIARRQAPSAGGTFLFNVADLRTQSDDGSGEFLLGREPNWADIVSGRAVKREFENRVKEEVDSSGQKIAILTGTAGSGKSSTLMRLALAYHAEGKQVGWLDSDVDLPLWRVREVVRRSSYNLIFIDDADTFGHSLGTLLVDLATDNPDLVIYVTLRNTRFDRLQVEDYLRNQNHYLHVVPHLEDSDIELLVDALEKAHRLGHLRGLSRQQRIEAFQRQAGRQLLVAMIQATSNDRFEEKIDSECEDLTEELRLVYAVVALATSLRSFLTRDEILLACGDTTNETLNYIYRLVNQKLLIELEPLQYRLRHRVVSDRVVEYFKLQGQMRDPLTGVLWAMATKAHQGLTLKSREQRLLSQLMNHEFMISITSDRETPRIAYSSVENMLSWNYHFYLQRGSYEVQNGDIDLAKNFLEQAKSMASSDYMVQTEWAYMTLKRAAMNPTSAEAQTQAEEALLELEDAIDKRGRVDYYPYHVVGSQGLSWIRRAILTKDEKARRLSELYNIVEEGVRNHPRRRELQQLLRDIERERLLLAVPSTP
jgi:hypothetical protein